MGDGRWQMEDGRWQMEESSRNCVPDRDRDRSPAYTQVTSSQDEYNSAYEARRDLLIENLTTRVAEKARVYREERGDPDSPANVMSTEGNRIDLLEAAFLIRHEIDPELGNQLIQAQAESPFRGGMFYIHDVMAATLFSGDGLTAKTKDAVRESLSRLPVYRGDTENHWVLYYTGLYLAAQTWPDGAGLTWFNGKSSSENLAESRAFLEYWFEITTTIGQGEFDSPTYLIVFLSPMFTLHAFAADPGLKADAGKMLDWLFADYAAEYLEGLYAGGHSRDYSYDAVEPERAPAVGWGWLHFGGPEIAFRSDNLLSAWGQYRLNYLISNVARDRSVPYTHYEKKRVRNVIRYGPEKNPPVYKTTYMTADYALGSLQGGILQPIQQHTWDVTFVDTTRFSTLFFLHPYYSAIELAMFFPEELEWLSDEVDRYHLVYTDPDKWNSSSPYERVFQHKNVLIALYDIDEEAHHGHIDGFFPKSLSRLEPEGSDWIFGHAGETFIAVRPLRPYEWIAEDGHDRLRSSHRKNGVVVEVARASEYDSFDRFMEAISVTGFSEMSNDSTFAVSYTTTTGDSLTFEYPEGRFLNGEEVRLEELPLFEGPYLNAAGLSRRLVVSHGGSEYVISF